MSDEVKPLTPPATVEVECESPTVTTVAGCPPETYELTGVLANFNEGYDSESGAYPHRLTRFTAEGAVLWQTDKVDMLGTPPTVANARIYYLYAPTAWDEPRRLACLDMDGSELWDVPVEREGIVIGSMAVRVNRPSVGASGNVYVSGQSFYTTPPVNNDNVTVHAFDGDGNALWDTEITVGYNSFYVGQAPQTFEMDGKLYTIVGNSIARLDPADGSVLYQTDVVSGTQEWSYGGGQWWAGWATGGKFYLVGQSHWAIDFSDFLDNTMLIAEDTGSAFAITDKVVLDRQPWFQGASFLRIGIRDITEYGGLLYLAGYEFPGDGTSGPWLTAYDPATGEIKWLQHRHPSATEFNEYYTVSANDDILYCHGRQYDMATTYYDERDLATGELLPMQTGLRGSTEEINSLVAAVFGVAIDTDGPRALPSVPPVLAEAECAAPASVELAWCPPIVRPDPTILYPWPMPEPGEMKLYMKNEYPFDFPAIPPFGYNVDTALEFTPDPALFDDFAATAGFGLYPLASLADGTMVARTGLSIVLVDNDLSLRWFHDISSFISGTNGVSSVGVDENGDIYVPLHGPGINVDNKGVLVHKLSGADGSLLWASGVYLTPWPDHSQIDTTCCGYHDGVLFVTRNGHLLALDAADGSLLEAPAAPAPEFGDLLTLMGGAQAGATFWLFCHERLAAATPDQIRYVAYPVTFVAGATTYGSPVELYPPYPVNVDGGLEYRLRAGTAPGLVAFANRDFALDKGIHVSCFDEAGLKFIYNPSMGHPERAWGEVGAVAVIDGYVAFGVNLWEAGNELIRLLSTEGVLLDTFGVSSSSSSMGIPYFVRDPSS